MKKHILPCLMAALLFVAAPALADSGGIAAIVNDSVVTLTDIQQRVDLYVTGAGQKLPPAERKKMEAQVLDKLIDEALQMQAAKKIGISVNEEQVNAGFEFVAKQNHLTADEFRKRLKDGGVNVDSLYAQIRAEIAWDQVVRRELRPQVNVSESEIDMTLDQIAQNGGKKQYRVAEIFVGVSDPSREKDAEEKAQDAADKIQKGATFSSVAREVSEAPGAATGGDLGWVQEGQLESAVDKALASMQTGQLSKPIRGEKGYYILFLRDLRTVAQSATAAAAAPDAPPAPAPGQGPVVLLKQIIIPVSNKDSESVIKTKFARGVALKKEIKNCDDLDKRLKDFSAKGSGTLGEGLQKDLAPPLRAIVEKLDVNELSAPLHMPTGWGMIMVCSRKDPAATAAAAEPAPAAPDADVPADKNNEKARENLADKLGTQRLNQMADHYLRDLRASAFIDKRI